MYLIDKTQKCAQEEAGNENVKNKKSIYNFQNYVTLLRIRISNLRLTISQKNKMNSQITILHLHI